ncbi:pentapeptide repeat-containing protein [Streptomyces sp. NPDC048304]|uniref:pentapeptide repeat-containing protein n=1 Tax=Streptomyces sp. NPDC048304 TaxID=3154820 RepID=UPI0033ED9FEC
MGRPRWPVRCHGADLHGADLHGADLRGRSGTTEQTPMADPASLGSPPAGPASPGNRPASWSSVIRPPPP